MKEPHAFRPLLPLAVLLAILGAPSASATPAAPSQPIVGPAVPALPAGNAGACGGGVVADDSTAETGYGWVPSAVDGVYVQAFNAGLGRIDSVCVCWLRTRADTTIDFEVVFYGDAGGFPVDQPFASVPASAADVPEGITGRFYEVDVSGVRPPRTGRVYVGVRWNPSVDQFFFVCADHTPETAPVDVFFIDDRARGWGSALDTRDPIFANHRAMMVRAVAGGAPVPTLGGAGAALLAVLLAIAGVAKIRS